VGEDASEVPPEPPAAKTEPRGERREHDGERKHVQVSRSQNGLAEAAGSTQPEVFEEVPDPDPGGDEADQARRPKTGSPPSRHQAESIAQFEPFNP
jgi:hypothetical protein